MGKTPEVTTTLKYIKQLLFTDTLKPPVPPIMYIYHRELFTPQESFEEIRFSLCCAKVEKSEEEYNNLSYLHHLSSKNQKGPKKLRRIVKVEPRSVIISS